MKTFFISTFLLLAFSISSTAQNLITVQNGNKVQFYTSLDSAYVHSSDGDTLYIPGGSYDVSGLIITKQLFIIGSGHNPDSTAATNISNLSGNLTIAPGAKGGFLTGFSLCQLYLGDTSINASNYTIERCNIGVITFVKNGSSPMASNNLFTENIIGNVDGGESTNNLFQNNIIGMISNFSSNNTFNHNIILSVYSTTCAGGASGSPEGNISGSTIKNNIIFGTISTDTKNCTIDNNIFSSIYGSITINLINGNVGSNNLIVGSGSLFVKYPVNNHYGFDYSADFHLISTCIGKNAGTGGSDIGIYGGTFPWKDGSLPYNPHIKANSVFGATDVNGNLKVNITVEAQGN